jgi:hypothetical protein
MAAYVTITDLDHGHFDPSRPYNAQGLTASSITVADMSGMALMFVCS